MSRLIFIFLFILIACLQANDWKLVWADEFDGTTVDESKWEFMIGTGTNYGLPEGWGNNERQYYRKENARVEEGHLIITAKKENYADSDYTSTRIRTKGKADWI